MATVSRRRSFSLKALFLLTAAAAVLVGAYRVHPVLAGLLVYTAVLVAVMAWFAWSDIAMSVCTILLVAGLMIAVLAMAM